MSDRKQINIYLETTIAQGKARSGVAGYILEYRNANGVVGTLSAGVSYESATRYQSEIVALTKAISRIGEPCDIKLFCSDTWMRSLINDWLKKWAANAWHKSNGKLAENSDLLCSLHQMIGDQCIIAVGDDHTYKKWLISEIRKAAFLHEKNGCEYITIPCK